MKRTERGHQATTSTTPSEQPTKRISAEHKLHYTGKQSVYPLQLNKKSIQFYKYHVCDDKIILIDKRDQRRSITDELLKELCNKDFAGANRVILLNNDEKNEYNLTELNPQAKFVESGNGFFLLPEHLKQKTITYSPFKFVKTNGEVTGYLMFKNENCEVRECNFTEKRGKVVITLVNSGLSHVAVFRPSLDSKFDIEEFKQFAKEAEDNRIIPNLSSVSFYSAAKENDSSVFKIFCWEVGIGMSNFCSMAICTSILSAIKQAELGLLKNSDKFNALVKIGSNELKAYVNGFDGKDFAISFSVPVKKEFMGIKENKA